MGFSCHSQYFLTWIPFCGHELLIICTVHNNELSVGAWAQCAVLSLIYYDVSLSLLGEQLVGNLYIYMYNITRSNASSIYHLMSKSNNYYQFSISLLNDIVLWSWSIWNLLVQPIGNQYMYGKKQKKVSEYGLNEINKRVLLLVPKPITIWEGTPTLMMPLGYPHDVISGGNTPNNKIKYWSELKHVYKQCWQSGTIWYMYERPLHLKPKTNN